MLVLSRKRGEALICKIPAGCSGTIVIKLVDIRSDKVRIGIEAPNAVGIMREELLGQSFTGLEPQPSGEIGIVKEAALQKRLAKRKQIG